MQAVPISWSGSWDPTCLMAKKPKHKTEVQFISGVQSCLTLCDPMGCQGFPVHHQLPEFAQTHVHWVDDAIRPSHPLSTPSPPAFTLSQHQGLFQWVSSSHQVAKVLEFQLQHQSFQWKFRTDWFDLAENRRNIITNSIKIFQMFYIKKKKPLKNQM